MRSKLALSSINGQSVILGMNDRTYTKIQVIGFIHEQDKCGVRLKIGTPESETKKDLYEGDHFLCGKTIVTLQRINDLDTDKPSAKITYEAPEEIAVNRETIFHRKMLERRQAQEKKEPGR